MFGPVIKNEEEVKGLSKNMLIYYWKSLSLNKYMWHGLGVLNLWMLLAGVFGTPRTFSLLGVIAVAAMLWSLNENTKRRRWVAMEVNRRSEAGTWNTDDDEEDEE